MSSRVLLSVLACAAGCSSALDFGSDIERTNLTYADYAREIGTHYVNPVGGSDICVRLFTTLDTSDMWLKVNLTAANFNALLTSHPSRNRLPETSGIGIPDDWPAPLTSTPGWWQLPSRTAHTRVFIFEYRDEVNPGGAYWQYDELNETLWVFDWDHQWGQCGQNQQ